MPRVRSSIEGKAADAFETYFRSLDIDGLRQQWRNLSGKAAGPGLTRSLLLRAIAYQRQVERVGDLPSAICEMLARLVEEAGRADDETAVAKVAKARRVDRAFSPGTILVREWQGVLHHVTVMKDGFAWNGTIYASLSRVAREITGINWNGHVFFGGTSKRATGKRTGPLRGRNRLTVAPSPAQPSDPR